jgi:hypothetical protein
MSPMPPLKLLARNVTAFRRSRSKDVRVVVGNPVSTRLESGVGNCFPGLECDLRNLERRFFPFLEVNLEENSITVVGADAAGAKAKAKADGLPASRAEPYDRIAKDVAAGRFWTVVRLTGTFGPLGRMPLVIADLQPPSEGQGRRPPDAWTAIRLLTEGTEVILDLRGPRDASLQLTGNRMRYLDDNGALAAAFVPGELTQSLCSPWTHDFRDCGCYYWASNHPDIALPPIPPAASSGPQWNLPVVWERQDRTMGVRPPPPATPGDPTDQEMRHQEISRVWQSLNFVVGRREIVTPFAPRQLADKPLAAGAELERYLRYAAGVELAVAHEYLSAAYSLKRPADVASNLREDIRVSYAELMRVAIGEMRHIRGVNEVLRSLATPGTFQPALQVAAKVPAQEPGKYRDVTLRPATRASISDFIDIERPSVSVDGVYARILATLERDGPHNAAQSIRTIMAEGEDHFQTFIAIQEWLRPHAEASYLRSIKGPPPAGDADHAALQTAYLDLLQQLHQGYSLGGAAGAPAVNVARMDMVGPLDAAAHKIAGRGFLVVFDAVTDPRFVSIAPPT